MWGNGIYLQYSCAAEGGQYRLWIICHFPTEAAKPIGMSANGFIKAAINEKISKAFFIADLRMS